MLQAKKVSIIVPIYKVEQYLRRCVDSLINQTYSNLEIILVNDGSPDQSGLIADQYQEMDARIKTIHKENGGLSDARNVGMKEVTGEFTMFVDSDDWIANDAIEKMVDHSLKYQADIVQAAFYYAYDDKLLIDNRYYQPTDKPTMLNNQSLMYELVRNEKVKNFAWGKLYRTNIIKDLPFMKGVLFEDVFWAHDVMHQVNHYVMIHEPLIYYFQRDDSIVAAYSPRNLDIIKGLKARHHFIEQFYPELINESYLLILKTCLLHYNLLVANRQQDKNKLHRWKIELYIQNNYGIFKEAVQDDKDLHRQLYLFSLHPYINISFLACRKILRKIKLHSRNNGLKQVNI